MAEEVRSLAARSAEAAKNTANLIEDSQKNADRGVTVTREVGSSFAEIAESSDKVGQLIGEVSAASREQSTGLSQVNIAIGQLDSVTQQNAATTEELSAQATEMSHVVQNMMKLVGSSEGRNVEALGGGGNHGGNGQVPTLMRSPTVQSERPVAHIPELEHKKDITPEQPIPLDDDEELLKTF